MFRWHFKPHGEPAGTRAAREFLAAFFPYFGTVSSGGEFKGCGTGRFAREESAGRAHKWILPCVNDRAARL